MTAGTVTVDGRRYPLWDGRILVDWRDKPILHHPAGCRLCCTLRVVTPGRPPRHPDDCPRCGPAYRGPRPDPCRYCQSTAHFRDDTGRPVHKTCLEHTRTAGETRKDAAA